MSRRVVAHGASSPSVVQPRLPSRARRVAQARPVGLEVSVSLAGSFVPMDEVQQFNDALADFQAALSLVERGAMKVA